MSGAHSFLGIENVTSEHDGYVLVFDRTAVADHKLTIVQSADGDELICDPPLQGLPEKQSKSLLWSLKDPELECRNFVKYELTYSEEHPERYIFCIVSIDEGPAMLWADKKGIDLEIDALVAVQEGRKIGFGLANSTQLPNEPLVISKKGEEFDKLPLELWEKMHLPYDRHCPHQSIYKRHGSKKEMLENRMQLRILFQILTEDTELGGAELTLDKFLNQSTHPLVAFFALHCPDENVPRLSKQDIYGCAKLLSLWKDKIEPIRGYYGEDVGFYFAFLSHYTQSLIPFAVFGVIWFIVQVATGKIAINPFADLGVILIGILWSTYMIEVWYRKEWIYNYRWGMLRFNEIAVPRPEFEGQMELSPIDGEIYEDYVSYFGHQCKLCCSVSFITMSIGIVISCAFGIWALKRLRPANTGWSIAIGLFNSAQIQLMNFLYLKLALGFNNWEDHRLQTEYDSHMAIKKITFYCVNSFFSLFYIAFIAPIYCVPGVNGATCTNKETLITLRIQLGSLFFGVVVTSAIIQLTFPPLYMWVMEKMYQRSQSEEQKAPLLADGAASRPDGAPGRIGIDASDTTEEAKDGSEAVDNGANKQITQATMSDAEEQIDLTPMTSMIDSMAEIIVPYGYVMLFITVFPLMPLLAMLSNFVQMRVDLYNMLHAQRPVPRATNGLGIWKSVIGVFAVVAVFSNMAILCYRSEGVKNLVGPKYVDIFFFSGSIVIVAILIAVRALVPDVPVMVSNAIERQEYCEKHLIVGAVKNQMTRLREQSAAL